MKLSVVRNIGFSSSIPNVRAFFTAKQVRWPRTTNWIWLRNYSWFPDLGGLTRISLRQVPRRLSNSSTKLCLATLLQSSNLSLLNICSLNVPILEVSGRICWWCWGFNTVWWAFLLFCAGWPNMPGNYILRADCWCFAFLQLFMAYGCKGTNRCSTAVVRRWMSCLEMFSFV